NYTRMFTEFWNAFSGDPQPQPAAPACPAPAQPDGYVLSYYDSPLRRQAASNELYIELWSQAERTAWLFTPYLMLGDSLPAAFVRAARRRRAHPDAGRAGQKAHLPHVAELLPAAAGRRGENLRVHAGVCARQGLHHRRCRRHGGHGQP